MGETQNTEKEEQPLFKYGNEKLEVLELQDLELNIRTLKNKSKTIDHFRFITTTKDFTVKFSPMQWKKITEFDEVLQIETVENIGKKPFLKDYEEFFPNYIELKKKLIKGTVKVQLMIQSITRMEDKKVFYKTNFESVKNMDILK